MAKVGALSPSKAKSSLVIPSYLGLEREADAVDGCGLLCEPEDLRLREEEPDACAEDEEGREPDRSGSERMSRTSLEVILNEDLRPSDAIERRESSLGCR